MINKIKKFLTASMVLMLTLIICVGLTACDDDVIAVTSVSINGSDIAIVNVGEQYTAAITPDNATSKTVTWEVVSGTATISEHGLLTATATGTVTIRATAEDKSDTKQITVNNPVGPSDPLQATFSGFEIIDSTTYEIKVSNGTESLNIANLATIESSWKLTSDMQATSEIPSKIATPLNIGNNTFYVLVSADNNIRLYTLQIRRRPVYEVSFNTNGGDNFDTQYIEEDSFASLQTEPTKTGYIFTSWNKDFTIPISENASFTANWEAITYNINYHLDGGTNGDNPATYTIETATIIFQDAEKSGHIFNGWYIGSNYTQLIENIPQGSHGNLVLYASFRPEPKELSAPTIEWDDITNTITVTNTDINADGVGVTVNGIQRIMTQNENTFTFSLGYSAYVGQIISITAYATSVNIAEFADSSMISYTSPYINRNFIKIKDPSLSWGASSGIFMFYLYRDLVNYTISYDGIIIMENNVFVNNGAVGTLSSIPGVVISPTDFDRYGYKFTPFSPEIGKTLTITFTLKNSVNPNAVNQYYFASEIVTCIITEL